MTDGQRIAEARTRAGLSQQDLAALLDLSASTISDYETGRRQVPAPRLSDLLAACDTAARRAAASGSAGGPTLVDDLAPLVGGMTEARPLSVYDSSEAEAAEERLSARMMSFERLSPAVVLTEREYRTWLDSVALEIVEPTYQRLNRVSGDLNLARTLCRGLLPVVEPLHTALQKSGVRDDSAEAFYRRFSATRDRLWELYVSLLASTDDGVDASVPSAADVTGAAASDATYRLHIDIVRAGRENPASAYPREKYRSWLRSVVRHTSELAHERLGEATTGLSRTTELLQDLTSTVGALRAALDQAGVHDEESAQLYEQYCQSKQRLYAEPASRESADV